MKKIINTFKQQIPPLTGFGLLSFVLFGYLFGFSLGWLVKTHSSPKNPYIDLPEEMICWVSNKENSKDTVYAYQSIKHDTLYIRLKP